MARKKNKEIEEHNIPVVIDNSEPKVESNAELSEMMERYRTFGRSLFGEDFELGKVKLKKGQLDPNKISMFRLQKEFILSQKSKGNSEQTIKSYIKNFNRLYDFLGFNYLRQGIEVIDYTLEHNEDFGTMRDIGASMPVTVFNLPNFIAFFNDYLSKVRHASPQTVLSAVRHLKAIIYFTQEQGWVDKYNIKIKELKPEIKSTFTADEIYRMGKKPKITEDNFVEYRTWVMIRYLSATGNRVSSMLALNVNDINFEDDTIRINTTKNNNPKLMPLPYELKKDLLQYIYKSRTDKDGNFLYREPLFSTMWGERLTYDGARAAFMDYFEARKIRWEGFHKFRHSYAANWIKDGGNPFMLKEYLGHSSLAMTNRYANIYGMATRKEAEEHSLINKFPKRHNNKKIRNKV